MSDSLARVRLVWSVARYVFLTLALVPTRSANAQVPPNGAPITWLSPEHCPAPTSQLTTLVNAAEKHPLWGSVTVTEEASGWHAHLQLRENSEQSTAATSERLLEGNTCAEVTDAALLVISIMQRELEREKPVVPVGSSAVGGVPPLLPIVAPPAAAPPVAQVVNPPTAPAPARHPSPATPPSSAATVGAGAAWSLWNNEFPTIGAIATGGYHRGSFAVRGQLGWATSVNLMPTSEAVRVKLTTYEAALRACGVIVSGLDVCAGPTLQRIEVVGREVDTPTRSNAWFPGLSAAMLGSQQHAGLGLWGELGVQFRFRQIALDLTPQREIATIDRHTFYAWLGPQWRWR